MAAEKEIKEITEAEVKKHDREEDLWMIIDNNVYDVTKFMDEHPGGADILVEHGGINATLAFEEVGHSEDARKLMEKYKIGTVKGGSQKFCFRLQQEEATVKRDKSVTSAKTSSVRICLPDSTDSRTKPATSADLERTKSITSTPSRVRCLSCCRTTSVCDSKSALDKSRTKSATSAKAPVKKPVSNKPSSHSDMSKTKPATARPPSQTETSRPPVNTVSVKTSTHMEPAKTKSAANSVLSSKPSAPVCAPSDRCKSASCSVSRIPKSGTDSKSATDLQPGSGTGTQVGPKPGTKTTPEPDPFAPPEDTSESSDMWKYALVALAGALVVTLVLMKTNGKI